MSVKEKKQFVKINIEDLVYAKEFFDNESDYIYWIYAVTEYYQGREVTIKKKIVKKYFDNYKKTMNIVIESKQTGLKGYLKKVENQTTNNDTLQPPLIVPLEVNNKYINSKDINSKEVNNKSKVEHWNSDIDIYGFSKHKQQKQ
jgi:hypothetical protein